MTIDTDTSATPDVKQLMEQAVAAKVLAELVKTADANVRAALLNELLDEYRASGKKQFDAEAFGMTGIGTITLPEGQDKAVVADADAFLDYVEENHPEQVRTIFVPETSWQKAFLASLDLKGEVPVNPLTEEPVPGLRVDRAGEPAKFNVNLSKTTIGQVTGAVLGRTVQALTEAANAPAAIESTLKGKA